MAQPASARIVHPDAGVAIGGGKPVAVGRERQRLCASECRAYLDHLLGRRHVPYFNSLSERCGRYQRAVARDRQPADLAGTAELQLETCRWWLPNSYAATTSACSH